MISKSAWQMLAACVAAPTLAVSMSAAVIAGEKLNDAKSAYHVGKSAFDVTRHAIGTTPKPNPVFTGIGLGQAAIGIGQGLREGYRYQQWKKPEAISPREGGRTIGYTAGVLTHRGVDRVRNTFRRR